MGVVTSDPALKLDSAVTVIGGYLGAGKTTLVNHILRSADERIAVLVNDFGDIDIDASLIESADGDTISLANGCICCSLVDGLSAALKTITELEPQPDRLVIEASGVADPASIAAYGHGPGLTLDAVVVVVDAETVKRRSTDKYVGDTVLSQLRSADIVVLNRIDLVEPTSVADTQAWLREIAPTAVIVESEHARVAPELLFGVVETSATAAPSGDHSDHGGHGGDVFESWSWSGDEPMDRERIDQLMAALPEEVVRAKGVVSLIDEPERAMVLQRVGARWSLRRGSPWSDEPSTRIVVIGLVGAIDDRWLAERLAG